MLCGPVHVMHVPGADPRRDEIVEQLAATATVCVHADPERKGCMSTWLSAVDCATRDETRWSVIVQDDAVPLPGWRDHLEEACFYSPSPVLGLTYFGSYGERPLAKSVPYATGQALLWGGGIAYRRDFLGGLAHWAPRIVEATGYVHDDRLACAYAARIGVKTALVARAILDQPKLDSLLGHNTLVRSPAYTIANTWGPRYAVVPRSVNVSYSLPKDARALLERADL